MIDTGPSSPPDRMYLEAVNSSTIKVIWTPIPRMKAHGLIRGYKIRYVKSVRGVQGRALSKSVFELSENKEGMLVRYDVTMSLLLFIVFTPRLEGYLIIIF